MFEEPMGTPGINFLVTHPPYILPHSLIPSQHTVCELQSELEGGGVTVVTGGFVVVAGHGGGVKVGYGLQSGKHLDAFSYMLILDWLITTYPPYV